jgi:hypothetical protein
MLKICLLLLSISLFARENPFFPLNSELDIPLSANKITKAPMLKRATLTLPSTAREIQSVTVRYKNLDGSMSEKKIDIDNSIDWHLPIFISQNYSLKKELKNDNKKKYKLLASLKFISFYINAKSMKIRTKDKMLRSFLLVKPHRIVCDFKRDIDLRSFEKKSSKNSIFKKINIGTHSDYYRVVIELDGYYKYIIKKTIKGYALTLL